MKTSTDVQERLKFLQRVIKKEIDHLNYAAEQVFAETLTLNAVKTLDANREFAMQVEAFTSRFCRLQDTLGDKLLPALLSALGEPERALLINLDKAEKYGWLDSTDRWMAIRQLRNLMIHEYIEDPMTLLDALTSAYTNITVLTHFADRLSAQVDEVTCTNRP